MKKAILIFITLIIGLYIYLSVQKNKFIKSEETYVYEGYYMRMGDNLIFFLENENRMPNTMEDFISKFNSGGRMLSEVEMEKFNRYFVMKMDEDSFYYYKVPFKAWNKEKPEFKLSEDYTFWDFITNKAILYMKFPILNLPCDLYNVSLRYYFIRPRELKNDTLLKHTVTRSFRQSIQQCFNPDTIHTVPPLEPKLYIILVNRQGNYNAEYLCLPSELDNSFQNVLDSFILNLNKHQLLDYDTIIFTSRYDFYL